MNVKDLKKLLEIARLMRDRDLAELGKRQDQRLSAETARIEFAQSEVAENRSMQENLEYRKGYEGSRRVWRDRQNYTLFHYEARAAALVEEQKLSASKSLGRANVVENLLEQAEKKTKSTQ